MSTRREFIKGLGLTTAGLAMGQEVFAHPFTSKETQAVKSEKVKIAYIGIGNRGEQNIQEFAKTNMVEVVALCDVDLDGKQCQKVLSMYPNAKRFRDFRKLFEEYADHFDAVAASVPDHIHFFVAMMALKYKKHIYLETLRGQLFPVQGMDGGWHYQGRDGRDRPHEQWAPLACLRPRHD